MGGCLGFTIIIMCLAALGMLLGAYLFEKEK